jgi:hypothetical protein
VQPQFVAVLLITALCTNAPLCASSILDTFGPADGFDSLTGDNNAFNMSVALPFTPAFSGTVMSAQIAASGLNTSVTPVSGTLFFDIRTSFAGLPGNTIIDSFIFSDVSTTDIVTAPSALNPLLQSGTQYWFVMEAAADSTVFFGVWHATSPSQLGSVAFEVGNGGWFSNFGSGVLAARITAIPVTPTPEPPLGLLTALSAMGLVLRRFRPRKIA